MKKIENKYFRGFIRVKNIILVLIIAALFFVIVFTMIARLTGGTPELFGNTLYRVSSGSMEPALKVGDVILSRACDPETLKKGDIVTYSVGNGSLKGQTITHRVIREPFSKAGKRFIVTKGDANQFEDSDVSLSDIKGKYVCKVEILNSLYNFFITPLGLITIIFLIVIAFFNEIVILVKAVAGIGYEEKKQETVEDIISRYEKENAERNLPDNADTTDDDAS